MNRKEELGVISRFLARHLFGLWSLSSETEKTIGEREGVGSSWEANGESVLDLLSLRCLRHPRRNVKLASVYLLRTSELTPEHV